MTDSGNQLAEKRLADPLIRWIEDEGWKTLRPIQVQAVNAILDTSEDQIICAATAGGKTEAAFLPLLTQLLNEKQAPSGFSLVYVAPLKALINDQVQRVKKICTYAEVPVCPWHGDVSSSLKKKARQNPSGVLLITPESLEALFMGAGGSIPFLFRDTQALIIDEWHIFLEGTRGVHLRSLLCRLDQALERRIRRVGLSATLGDLRLAQEYMCPENPQSVQIIEDKAKRKAPLSSKLTAHMRSPFVPQKSKGYHHVNPHERSITKSIFNEARGSKSLVFVSSRYLSERYASLLKDLCRRRHIDNEFFPHHGCLSKEHRQQLEKELKSSSKFRTIVCTRTLELGIDVGDIDKVIQVGCARSVSSLRQRIGRSGREKGAIPHLDYHEVALQNPSPLKALDFIHLNFMVSVALIALLQEGRYEPPPSQGALHLSTLTHQILAVICERRRTTPSTLYRILCCAEGPFSQVSEELFKQLLLNLEERSLIRPFSRGAYILGHKGESLTSHYSFYASFKTPIQYEVKENGKLIGFIDNPSSLKKFMVFSGKSLKVKNISQRAKTIIVEEKDQGGLPPSFFGRAGDVHDLVMAKVAELYQNPNPPAYSMCEASRKILEEARKNFRRLGFHTKNIHRCKESGRCVVATWKGSVKNLSLAVWLKHLGYKASSTPGFLHVSEETPDPVEKALLQISKSKAPSPNILKKSLPLFEKEKFHSHLNTSLLYADIMSSQLNMAAVPQMCREILSSGTTHHPEAA